MSDSIFNKIPAIVAIAFLLMLTLPAGDNSGMPGTAYAAEPKAHEEKKDSAGQKDKKPAAVPKLKEIISKDKKDEKPGDAKGKEKEAEKKDEKHDDAKGQEKDAKKKDMKPGEEQAEEVVKPKEKPVLPSQTSSLSPEMFQMMEMIEKKNRELKKREEEIQLKEQTIKALEQQVKTDLEKIELAMKKSQEQFGMREGLIEKNVASLVKVYSTMKPAEAAAILATMEEDIAVQIVSRMKSKTAGQVLGKMDGKVAKSINMFISKSCRISTRGETLCSIRPSY